jgi:Bacterial SH3 domain
MMHRSIPRAIRCASSLTVFLFTLSLFFAAGIAFAVAVDHQVELATHQAGVPFHNAPGGTKTFQRVPTGTIATVIDSDRGGRWLQIRVPDQRTGWIAARYVWRTIADSPPPETSAERLVWSSPEGCQQVVESGGRMASR